MSRISDPIREGIAKCSTSSAKGIKIYLAERSSQFRKTAMSDLIAPSFMARSAMPVTPLDILIAHKAINLSTSLSNSDKQVAGILLDHFNRKTMQCDPSLESVADLASMSRRTVMRSVGRLERQGFFRKVRHGGKFHRNMYEPGVVSFS